MLRMKYISAPAVFFILAAATLTLFFELWRILFLVFLGDLAAGAPLSTLLKTLVVGLRFDFSITSYVILPLYLFSAVLFLFPRYYRTTGITVFYLLVILSAMLFFAHLADIEFTRHFHTRLNDFLLQKYKITANGFSPIWFPAKTAALTVIYLLILYLYIRLVRYLVKKILIDRPRSPWWINLIYLPILIAAFGVGARGRLAEEPMRWGMAYYSEYDFANLAALNPVYTFILDAVYDHREKKATKDLMSEIKSDHAENELRQLLGMTTVEEGTRLIRPVRFEQPNENPPSVILIIMESFGSTKIDVLDNRFPYSLTPCFDSLAAEGFLFTDFYSCGKHTFASLVAVLYGYPPQYGKLVMRQLPGENYLWGLPSILKTYDYKTSCFVTTDPHFDNMQGFLMANGIMKAYSKYDIGEDRSLSWMGVPDHVMFDFACDKLRENKNRRFFATLLTASNHGPWLLPDVPFGRLPDTVEDAHKLNAFKYSDWALGQFVNKIKSDPFFDNTLIIITADNGSPYKQKSDLEITHFQIPLLIIGNKSSFNLKGTSGRPGSQLDILPTLMGILKLDYDNYSFGKDLLDTSYRGTDFVHFVEKDLLGHIENGYYLINRLHGKETLYKLPDVTIDLADSLKETVDEYRMKSEAIFQTAYYNMKRPLSPMKF
ncbi:MAG: sulfatase-like hydrolase/transferase [candidate division Zixibacteria bacterium]|nr:sulfatase-like hydrolase/transferase [candidate division Zixibacteria bacterium]MDD5425819.1 sulfatase-like hydrolase/transferase [candidate division Zixibacteria bacterium]